jgi:hypothetical protein
MQLWRGDIAGLTGFGDDLTALDLIAALDGNLAIIGISGGKAVGMTDQHEIAISFQLASGIDDGAVFSRFHGCALRHGDIDAVIGAGFERLDDPAAHWPAEFRIDESVGVRLAVGVGSTSDDFADPLARPVVNAAAGGTGSVLLLGLAGGVNFAKSLA